eukprot:TRINITY_DN13048_c0_g1_i1.p1 TRINITY_DN13048_c0_g1~~TRINITY_DN13048_c0_g1_i1.p1  ORF type:complete len:145 (-),score=51.89 TRINITY_DN13048_c0_g1_i1:61-447(-)
MGKQWYQRRVHGECNKARTMENIFEKQGIKFKIITEDMGDSVCDFMWENFFPDEPISRSLKLERHWVIDEGHLKDSIKDCSSIAALDSSGSIIGVRLGKRKRRSQWILKIFERSFMSLPGWCWDLSLE